MKRLIFACLIFCFHSFFAQEAKEMGVFSTVKVYDRIHVELINSNKNLVEIDAPNTDEVVLENKNGELRIKMSFSKTMQGEDVKVKVFFKNLISIQASQGSEITSDNVIKSNVLELISNEGSKINLEVNVSNLTAKLNSGGIINLKGIAENQDLTVNSGGQLYAQNCESKNTNITLNAGGEAEIFASNSVNITTRAGGEIEVYGNPTTKKWNKVVGGRVTYK